MNSIIRVVIVADTINAEHGAIDRGRVHAMSYVRRTGVCAPPRDLGRRSVIGLAILGGMLCLLAPLGAQNETVGFAQTMRESMMRMHSAMNAASASGNADRDFASMMIPHHQGAIDMAKAELLYGKDPRMRRLAQEIIVDQQSEIEAMKLWLSKSQANSSKEK